MSNLQISIETEKIISQLIEAQTKSLKKAIVELIQNARDSVLSKKSVPHVGFRLKITNDKIIIVDYGVGFDLRNYARIGYSEKNVLQGSAVGQFGIGRLQILQYGTAYYATETQKIVAKYENKKLSVEYSEGKFDLPIHVGCLVEIQLNDRGRDEIESLIDINESFFFDFNYEIEYLGKKLESKKIDDYKKFRPYEIMDRPPIYLDFYYRFVPNSIDTAPVYQNGIKITEIGNVLPCELIICTENVPLTMDRSSLSDTLIKRIGYRQYQLYNELIQKKLITEIDSENLDNVLLSVQTLTQKFPESLPDDLKIQFKDSGLVVEFWQFSQWNRQIGLILDVSNPQIFINRGIRCAVNLRIYLHRYLTSLNYKILSETDPDFWSTLRNTFTDLEITSLIGLSDSEILLNPLVFVYSRYYMVAYSMYFLIALNQDKFFSSRPRKLNFVIAAEYHGATDGSTFINLDFYPVIRYYVDISKNDPDPISKKRYLYDTWFQIFYTLNHEYQHKEVSRLVRQHTNEFYFELENNLLQNFADFWIRLENFVLTKEKGPEMERILGFLQDEKEILAAKIILKKDYDKNKYDALKPELKDLWKKVSEMV